MNRPVLLLVAGTHGAGKTTLAKLLAEELGWPLVSRDAVRTGLAFSVGEQMPEPGGEVSQAAVVAFSGAIHHLVRSRVSLIAESPFRRGISEADLAPIAELADIRIIQCRVSREIAIERCRARPGLDYVATMLEERDDRSWARVEQPLDLRTPVLSIDTSDGYRPALRELVHFARCSRDGAFFMALHQAGKEALASGAVVTDAVPVDGGRWGLAILLRLVGDLGQRLGALTEEAVLLAGPHQWPTGAPGSAHVTVRALDSYRSPSSRDPEQEREFVSRMVRAGSGVGPVRLTFNGLYLSPATVGMSATSPDDSALVLRRALADLFTDDVESTTFRRDPIWYVTILNFTGPIRDTQALTNWVESHQCAEFGEATFDRIELCRYDYDARLMKPTTLAAAPLAGL